MSNCVPFDGVFVIIFFFTSILITDSGDYTITKKTDAIIFVIKVIKIIQCTYLQLRYQHHILIYHQMLELSGNRNLFIGVAFNFFSRSCP